MLFQLSNNNAVGDFRLCFKETEVILRSLQYGHGGKVLESAFLNIGDLIV